MRSSRSAGNALFIILIALALFAALSYAVTQSGRGSGDVTNEQILIDAAKLIQTATSVRTAITRMMLTGTSLDNLDFCSTGAATCTLSTRCVAGADCVFAPEGGGAIFPELPAKYSVAAPLEWTITKSGFAVTGVGTAAGESYLLSGPLTQQFCEAINRGLGLSLPVATDSVLGDPWDAYPGEPFQCFRNLLDRYYYVHVLVEF